MIGMTKVTVTDIPEDGMIGKKLWCDYYLWDNWEQYQSWRAWALKECSLLGERNSKKLVDYLDLRYGLNIGHKKEGLLF